MNKKKKFFYLLRFTATDSSNNNKRIIFQLKIAYPLTNNMLWNDCVFKKDIIFVANVKACGLRILKDFKLSLKHIQNCKIIEILLV